MALSEDLLDVARELATLDSGKPRQAALRRAVSTAYYAAFHFLIEEATAHVGGANPGQARVRAFLSRGFQHSAMADVCKDVSNGNWPNVVRKRLGQSASLPAISPKLKEFAGVFRPLQLLRHQADYDTLTRFSRANVVIEIDRVAAMMADWPAIPDGEAKSLFLYVLTASPSKREAE